MFSHVTVGTNDVARAKTFYDGVGKALGLERLADYPEAAGYGLDKKTATVGNGVTIGLDAANRPAVDAAYKAGMAAGGKDEGAPGLRTHYHPNYYGAYLRDPDGNKVCVVCHRPA